ncbi:MAG: SurA N-terminal domain-containing protein [bacterium]|nr:SurA N-terminal domain-containing protein [bacterium]
MQKIAVTLLCLVFLLAALSPQASRAAVVDRNVVIVNNDTITLSEVNELAKPYFDQVRAQAPAEQQAEGMAQARRMVVERLIDKRLVAQEAAKRNLRVSDAELDSSLQQLLLSRNVTPDEFQEELKNIGLSEKQYREELRDQILSTKVINAVVRSKVLIPEEKILERYYSKAGAGGQGSYNLLQIGVAWGLQNKTGKTLTKKQAKEKIEQIRKQALAGAGFAQLAAAHSDLPSAEEGGALGNFRLQDMAASIRTAVETLQLEGVSPVVEQEPNFLIFKRIASPTSTQGEEVEQVSASPDAGERERIHQELFQEEMEKRLQQWLQELRGKAYIKIL